MVRYIQDPFRVGADCRGGALGVPWGRPGVVLVGALEMSWGRAPQDDPRTTPGHFGGALGMSWGALPCGTLGPKVGPTLGYLRPYLRVPQALPPRGKP